MLLKLLLHDILMFGGSLMEKLPSPEQLPPTNQQIVEDTDMLVYNWPSNGHLAFQKPAIGSAQIGHQ